MENKEINMQSFFIDIVKSKQFPLQGQINFQGLKISVENRKGSIRQGVDPNGRKWRTVMRLPYGYIKGVLGKDKDHLDCFVGNDRDSQIVFVVNQIRPWTKNKTFDEHKVMLGFTNYQDAKKGYLMHYDSPKYFGSMVAYTIEDFKKRIGFGKKGVYKVDGNTFKKANEFEYYIDIEKSIVNAHERKTKTGKLIQVRQYENKKNKKQKIEEMVDLSGWITPDGKWLKHIGSHKQTLEKYNPNIYVDDAVSKYSFIWFTQDEDKLSFELRPENLYKVENFINKHYNSKIKNVELQFVGPRGGIIKVVNKPIDELLLANENNFEEGEKMNLYIDLEKAHVKSYKKTLKSGKIINVKDYENKKNKIDKKKVDPKELKFVFGVRGYVKDKDVPKVTLLPLVKRMKRNNTIDSVYKYRDGYITHVNTDYASDFAYRSDENGNIKTMYDVLDESWKRVEHKKKMERFNELNQKNFISPDEMKEYKTLLNDLENSGYLFDEQKDTLKPQKVDFKKTKRVTNFSRKRQ